MLAVDYLRVWMLVLCGVHGFPVLRFFWSDLCNDSVAVGSLQIEPESFEGIVDLSSRSVYRNPRGVEIECLDRRSSDVLLIGTYVTGESL
jgi:hypothetical protein